MFKRSDVKDMYPLSPMQQGMLFHNMMDNKSNAYFEQTTFSINGNLDIDLFEKSFNQLIKRYDALRTIILYEKIKQPMQVVLKERNGKIFYTDISDIKEQKQKLWFENFKQKDMEKGFNLSEDMLIRIGVIKIGKEKYRVLWSSHHIMMDGWCLGIIIKDFFTIYHILKYGKKIVLPEVYPYSNYIKWLEEEDREEGLDYWRNYLEGYEAPAGIPQIKATGKDEAYERCEISFIFDEELTKKIEYYARKQQVTVNTVLQAAWAVLLQRYNNTEDVVFGNVVAGRPSEISGIEGMVGLFINTVPVRAKWDNGETFDSMVAKIQESSIESQKYEYLPLPEIQANTKLKSNLFNSIMIFENYPMEESVENICKELELGFSISDIKVFEQTNYNFNIAIIPGKEMIIRLNYNAKVYDKIIVKNIKGHLIKVLDTILANKDNSKQNVEIITDTERNLLVGKFNATSRVTDETKLLHVLFEEQVKKTPRQIALKINSDFDSLIDELESNEENGIVQQKLLNCCFKRNEFVYCYEDERGILAASNSNVEDILFCKTNEGNIVLVNRELQALINIMDGSINLKSIFTSIGFTNKRYILKSLSNVSNLNAICIEYIECNNKDDLICLIKILFKSNLIQLVDYNSKCKNVKLLPVKINLALSSNKKNMDEKKHIGFEKEKKTTIVLLLGDTNGNATTGLLYLASYLRRNGIEAYCQWNDISRSRQELKANVKRLIGKYKPDIVGISMKWFPHIARVLEMCSIIKKLLPEVKIVLGGNTASYYAKEIIKEPNIDYIIMGDGEIPLLRICQKAAYLPNCIYKKGEDIAVNPISYVQNENNSNEIFLSHMEEIFTDKLDPYYSPYFFIYTGKGCSMNCFYCAGCKEVQSQSFNRKLPFMRNIEQVREDIKVALKYTAEFMFDFDLPNYDSIEYYKSIWEGIDLSRHFCSFYFWKLPEKQFLSLVSSTFKYCKINIDLCSLSDRHRMQLSELKLVKPQPTDKEIYAFFQECEQYKNFGVTINIIAGLPYFKKIDIEESEKCLNKLIERYYCFKGLDWGRLHAQPGAILSRSCEEHGTYTTASSYEDFLRYSKINLESEIYPNIAEYNYPFIYFKDEEFNSKITRHYIKAERILKSKINKKRRLLQFEEQISYEELNHKANKLARTLRLKGIKPEDIVGVMSDRSIDMIIGIMAILKAGAAYLSIDPEYPQERIKYILSDSGTKLLLTQSYINLNLINNLDKIFIDDIENYGHDYSNLLPVNTSQNIAYIIYTSGSTGLPKGVMIEHRSICNSIQWRSREYNLTSKDKVLQLFSSSFDGFLTSFFTPVISGATVVLTREEEAKNPFTLNKIIQQNGITHFVCVPTLYSEILRQSEENELETLKTVTLAGESVSSKLVEESKQKYKDIELVNEYGPTEASVVATIFRDLHQGENIFIGKPILNTQIYILNSNNQLQPIGALGELCISGIGLARGYLNRKQLTCERFIDNPFAPNTKMYKTGDLARWSLNGNIDLIGRIDNQVKVRGFRIELGEIEKVLLAIDGILEAVVEAKEGSEGNYICAYIVGEKDFNTSKLRKSLANKLPQYMIPTYFMQIETMPFSPNGKVDRKALLKIDESTKIRDSYTAPSTDIEKTLVNIWQEVLGVEKVGIDDNFFDRGGHSLKATILAARIQKELEVKVSIMELFKLPTIKEFAEHINSCQKSRYCAIKPASKRQYYPVSSVQKRLFTLQNIDLDGTAYNMPQVFMLDKNVDKGKMENAFKQLILHHEILRTSFKFTEGEIWQKIHDEIDFNIEYYEEDEEKRIKFIVRNFIRPFNLSEAPLIRVGLIKITPEKYLLMTDMHHIVSDGRSIQILIDEFIRLYEGKELNKLKLQYKDYAVWQNEILKKDEMQKQKKYWLNEFAGEIPVLSMPVDRTRPLLRSTEGGNYSFIIEEKLSADLKAFALENGATIFMVLLEAFSLTLSKYSGQEDIIIGTVTAGREHADIQNLIGVFLNSIAFRCLPNKGETVDNYLQEIKQTVLKGYENQSYPFEEIIDKLNLNRDLSRNALFDVMLIYQNYEKQKSEVKSMNFSIDNYESDYYSADYDMTMYVNETGDSLEINIVYYSEIFEKAFIERFAVHFNKILNEILSNSDRKLEEIHMLPEEERNLVIEKFNNTTIEYPKDKSIKELMEETVEKVPDKTAVIFENEKLTYRQLNEKTNQLARILREKGVGSDCIVGIMLERSVEMVIASVAVLKSGGAYLAIDPDYPEDRIRYMLKDSNVIILLTDNNHDESADLQYVTINVKNSLLYQGDYSNLENISKPTSLAYIVYTSGTTGMPKGVMVEQRNLLNMVYAWKESYELEEFDVRLLQIASMSFDVFSGDLMRVFTNGGTMVICPKEVRLDPAGFYNLIQKQGINIFETTPSLVIPLIEYIYENKLDISSMKMLVMGSDSCSVENFIIINGRLSNRIRVINSYGITEATIDSSFYEMNKNTGSMTNLPIGKPMQNTKMYILDEDMNPKAVGHYGELYVGGEGVARGYLNKPELTSERFIEDPFAKKGRMYKTGDIARWLPDGNAEFAGRIDNQVKIRGCRIELGEIENCLRILKEVSEAVVTAREDERGKYLCAYLVSDEVLDIDLIRNNLMQSIPSYMVPSKFIQIDKIPLTTNGKIDRKALPEPEGVIYTGAEYEAPRNETEQKLAEIWQDILKVERIGINDNFFELGGHSLTATTLTARIQKELEVKVPLKQIFEKSTIKGQAEYIESSEMNRYAEIEKVEEKEYYPVSSAQKRMYAMQQFDIESTAYNIPAAIEIEGKLDIKKLEDIFEILIKRHESLRTSFEIVGAEIVQKINKDIKFKIKYFEMCEEYLISEKISTFIRPFDVSKAPLFRAGLIKVKHESYILMYDIHHIISDGASMEILFQEISALYENKELEELKIQYKDYAEWQNKLVQEEYYKKQKKYWLDRFQGGIPVLNMPTDYPRPVIQSFEGRSIEFEIEKKLTEGIKRLSQKTGSTVYMILLAAYNVLLSKYSGQEDIIVGSPIAGRPHADIEKIIGMFVNTLAMRNRPEGQKSFTEFLQEVRQGCLEAYENQNYQFEELVEKLELKRDIGRNPLFDTMLVMQNIPSEATIIKDIVLKPYNRENETVKFDLSIEAIELQDIIAINIEYCSKLFNRGTINRLNEHYTNILSEIVKNPEASIEAIDMLTEKEKKQLLVDFNKTKAQYPKDKIIHQIFEEQVELTPEHIAVVIGNEKLTYQELNEKANQLATKLRNKGVKRDELVGLMAEKSLEMIVGILGVLKAGGAYLPIDPEYPEERIKYMLEDSGSKTLLTQKRFEDSISFEGEIICLDDENTYKGSGENLENINKPEDLAYVIYTSGTTGKPKGAMIEHKNVVRLLFNEKFQFEFNNKDVWTMFHSHCFDFSVWEMYGAVLYGGKLVIIPSIVAKDTGAFLKVLKEEKVTVLNQTPSAFYRLTEEELKEDKKQLTLKYIIFGGEALKPIRLGEFHEKYPETKLINMYGITETTVHVTYKGISQKEIEENISNIGAPIPTLTTYIMDKNMKLQPIGVAGEICVGGDGVGRGYLNRKELTEEKFVTNPYKEDERIYRSGDLARMLPNGELEYLGRIDYQVKIRGYRIELGEIESRILGHEDVKEAVIIVKSEDSGDKYLVAYFVANRQLTVGKLREYLKRNIPEYMIPSYFVQLYQMPLTPNGKIDRRALPEPEGHINTGVEYEVPRNEVEQKLIELWQDILKVERIGINDNFFEIGGHSLKATILAAKIQKELEVKVPLKEIFAKSSIKNLAEYINNCQKSRYYEIKPADKREYYPVSSVQRRLYTLQNIDLDGTAYNMPQVFVLEGNIDKENMENAFRKLMLRHEILMTSFKFIEGNILQKIHDEIDFNIEYYEEYKEDEEGIRTIVRNFIRPFDLSDAPLIRVGLIKITSEKYILMTDMHHIVSDGTSMGILIDDFIRLYEGKHLNELKLQYKDYAVWQNEILKKDGMLEQEKYWLKEFTGEIPVLSMPADKVRPLIRGSKGDNYHFTIAEKLSAHLRRFALQNQATIFMVLLEAFSLTLSKYSGQEDIIIGTVTAGRDHADIQSLIGVFLNSIAFKCLPEKGKIAEGYLQEIKEIVLKGYENQSYPFEDIIDKLNLNRDLSRNALFDVMLIYQNFEKQQESAESMNFSINSYESDYYSADYDMTMYVDEIEDRLEINILYYREIFLRDSIEKFAVHFTNILEEIIRTPDSKLEEINMLPEEERKLVLEGFNNTGMEYQKEKSIKKLIEEIVEKVPDKTAVIFEDKQLSYRALNEKSNQLARILRRKGIENDCIVGIMLERSVEMVIAALAVIKSGGAYLAIDTDYPEDRIKYMLNDSNVKILLADCNQHESTSGLEYYTINVKDSSLYQGDCSNLQDICRPNDLAYIIYTSGTTGKPKGVMVEQRNLLNMVYAWKRSYELEEFDVHLLQIASMSFDVFPGDLMRVFPNSGTMIICPKEVRLDPAEFYKLIQKHGINIFETTPSLVIPMMEYIYENNLDIRSMKILVLGGDSCSVEDFKRLNERFSKIMRIINNYGIAEATIDSSFYEINENTDSMTNLPIGKPMQNIKLYILDEDMKPKAIGHYGELYIGGEGVARGYLNNPELTKERFIKDPFAKTGRMYKTGDIARWLSDGNVEFVGRIDNQIKLRGYRIELGEIEHALKNYRDVKEVVVTVREDEWGKHLCAYLVSDSILDIAIIRKYLTQLLPNYMIPSYFLQLNKIPLTPNGKIDRKALPAPEGLINTGVEYEAPGNETEQKLAEIWQDILKVERVGINNNFFELGGHSLTAITLAARIQKELEVKVPLKEIFEKSTIKGLAEYIDGSEKNRYAEIEKVEEKEYYPVSSAQKRMYMLQQFDAENTSYNIAEVIEIEGKLDIKRLEKVFERLVNRQESLRTSFEIIGEKIVQKIHKNVSFGINYSEETNEEIINGKIRNFVRPFNLSKAPLIRVGLIKVHPESHILLYDIHHIISDGTSMGIIFQEISMLYKNKELEELKIQYKDYAEWQGKLKQGELYKKQEKYWLDRYKGKIPVLNLPIDYERPVIQELEGAKYEMEFGEELTQKLEGLTKKTGATLYMVLLAAYNILLYKFSGQEDIIVGSPIAGRPHVDLEKTIGMFVNTLAMRNKLQDEKSFMEFLNEVKTVCLEAYENQDYQFEDMVEHLEIKRENDRNPIFNTMLVLQNLMTKESGIEGIIFKPYKEEINNNVKMDMTFTILEDKNNLIFSIEYMSSIFNRKTVKVMGDKYLEILKTIVNDCKIQIKDILLNKDFLEADTNILKKDSGDFDFD